MTKSKIQATHEFDEKFIYYSMNVKTKYSQTTIMIKKVIDYKTPTHSCENFPNTYLFSEMFLVLSLQQIALKIIFPIQSVLQQALQLTLF